MEYRDINSVIAEAIISKKDIYREIGDVILTLTWTDEESVQVEEYIKNFNLKNNKLQV